MAVQHFGAWAVVLLMFIFAGCNESNPMPSPGKSGENTGAEFGEDGTWQEPSEDVLCAPELSSDAGGWWSGDEVMSAEDLPSAKDVAAWDGGGAWEDSVSPGSDSGIVWDPNGDSSGCIPSCENQQCGPDGCGGTCGWCSGTASCQDGACVEVPGCTPACAGLMIGEEDGCGGLCSGGGFGIGLKPGGAQDVGYFRALVADGQVPTADLFPIEGFLNEHDTPLPPPDYSMLVTLHAFLGLFYDPEANEPLISMQLGLNSGLDPSVIESSNFNLVVVVDTSGSMAEANKLDLVKQGLVLMLDELDENDLLTIVTYSTNAKIAVDTINVTEDVKPNIEAVIDSLQPEGSTNLWGGLELGYKQAMENITDDAVHRVMLLSDGLITEGEDNTTVILNASHMYNEEGIGITTVGVGLSFDFDLMYQLASQGNGNFYFIDGGEKLIEVFQHEIQYLLTPVAENLKISFRLPEGFAVDDIYGFDFQTSPDGEVVLLGPSPQYTVGPEQPTGPDNPPPDPDDKQVSVSTLFASKKNGLLMAKIRADNNDIFASWQAISDFAQISYSYDLVNEGKTEYGEKVVEMGTLKYFAEDDPDSGMAYFTGPIMQRNFCVLRTALAVRQACTLYHQEPQDVGGAVVQIADAITFCNGINFQLSDPALDEDVAFMESLKQNICILSECQPQ